MKVSRIIAGLAAMTIAVYSDLTPANACTPPNTTDWKETLKKAEQSRKAAADVIVIGRFVRTLKNKIEYKLVYPKRVLRGQVKRFYLIPAPISTCEPYPPENTPLKLYLSGQGDSFGVVAYEKIK